MIDGRHCNGADSSGCAGQTSTSIPTVSVGNQIAFGIPAPTVDRTPDRLAVDDVTHTLYVTNAGDDTVSVIDVTHCHAGHTSQCASQTPPSIPLPSGGAFKIQVDPSTNNVYVANLNDSSVSVIDGRHCNTADTTACSHIPNIEVGSNPSDLTLDLNQAQDRGWWASESRKARYHRGVSGEAGWPVLGLK